MTESPTIFVVDDDKEDQLILEQYFSDIGVFREVSYFDNGEAAINHLEALDDSRELPKLIVLDLNMPVLNGTQTLLYLKRTVRYKAIPVIIFSTSENEDEKRKCLSYGAIDYVVKPMTWEEGQSIAKRLASFIS